MESSGFFSWEMRSIAWAAPEIEPSSYDLVFALGDFLLRQRRFADVRAIADRLAAIDPSRPEAGQIRSLAGAPR